MAPMSANHYRMVLAATAYDLNASLVKFDEGADLKAVNDKVIQASRTMLETALVFKGQEESNG